MVIIFPTFILLLTDWEQVVVKTKTYIRLTQCFVSKRPYLKVDIVNIKSFLSIRLWGSWDVFFRYKNALFYLLFCSVVFELQNNREKNPQNYSIKKQCLAAGSGNFVFSAWQIFLQEFTNLKTKWYEGRFSVMTEITLCETVLN